MLPRRFWTRTETVYQLVAKPVTGQTLVWDLSTDLKSKLLKANTETVPPGTVLAGPVYLDQLRVVKPAGAPASVVFTESQVIDPAQGTMALAEEPLFDFTPDQPWLDVNVVRRGPFTRSRRGRTD